MLAPAAPGSFSSGEHEGSDAPPRSAKPKQPFLKRGEGVNRRLNAFKLKEHAAAVRRQRAAAEQPDQAGSSPAPRQQHVWEQQQQQHAGGYAGVAGEDSHASSADVPLRAFAAAAGEPLAAGSVGRETSHAWEARQVEEDLELEEFRALEREILGDSSRHGQGGVQQQQQQQQRRQHQQELHANGWAAAADGSEPAAAGVGTASWQQQLLRTGCAHDPQREPAAADGSGAGTDGAGLAAPGWAGASARAGGSSPGALHFQDDTEWVDTEFSFANELLGSLQQQQQQQQQQSCPAQPPEQPEPDDKGSDGPLAQQPYLRSLFHQQRQPAPQREQQQQHVRPPSGGSSRADTAAPAGRRKQQAAQRPGSAAARSQARPQAGQAGAAAGSSSREAQQAAQGDEEEEGKLVAVAAAAVARWQALEAAQPGLQQERTALRKMRAELERTAAQLETQRAAWERQKAEHMASLEAWRLEEGRRLAKERRVLEQQSKALLKLPSKKEKGALDALEAALERERSDARAAAARQRLTVERLRCQIKDLQERNAQLQEELRWHEAQQLSSMTFTTDGQRPRRKAPSSSAQTQTDAALLPPAANGLLAAGRGAASSAPDALYAALFGEEDDSEASSSIAAGAQPRGGGRAAGDQQAGRGGQLPNGVQLQPGGGWGIQQALPAGTGARPGSARGRSAAQPPAAEGGSEHRHQPQQQQQEQQQQQPLPANDSFSFVTLAAQDSGGSLASQASAAAVGPGAGRPAQLPGSSVGEQQQQQQLVRELRHADGKLERLLGDGSRELRYANGTLQTSWPDGSSLVRFQNGDIRAQAAHGGRIDYYYAEVATWQCSLPGGLEVFHFPTGQVEGHHADGRKEIIFPDGAAALVEPHGDEQEVPVALLSAAVRQPPPDISLA